MHNERCTSGSEGGLEKPTGRKIGRALRSDPTLNPSEIGRPLRIAVGIAGLLLLGACACPARADEMPAAGPKTEASRLVEEVLHKAGDDDLGEWTRSIMDRALKRAGETARRTIPQSEAGVGPGTSGQTAPLPAERHAAGIAEGRIARNGAAEILIFTSLSVPAASWRQWADDAARAGAPLVLRGVGAGGLRETVKRIGARLGSHAAGVAIDPRLFRLFGIERVPAVVVVPGGVPPCESRGCSGDPAPPHDLVAGNIGLDAALEAVAAEGDAGRAVAKAYLGRLTGDGR